jgi:hypothetical protein
VKPGAPIAAGRVDWTGENPGILLKETPDGPFSAMALFFRIAWSPVGQGQVLLLYADPNAGAGAANVLISDNRPLADYLKDNFIARLQAFREAPAFASLRHLQAHRIRSSGDPMGRRYCETVAGEGIAVELVWEELDAPRALELPPELTGTKVHAMSTLLVPARDAQIWVNGRRLPGRPAKRVQAGVETTTAFLYFSETWVVPPNG